MSLQIVTKRWNGAKRSDTAHPPAGGAEVEFRQSGSDGGMEQGQIANLLGKSGGLRYNCLPMLKKLGLLIVGLVIVLGLGGWLVWTMRNSSINLDRSFTQTSVDLPTPISPQPTPVETVSVEATQSGVTAFELLTANSQVDYDRSSLGVFIKSIDGVTGDNNHYWAIYVNDQYATSSADTTILSEGDRVEFRYEEINQAGF